MKFSLFVSSAVAIGIIFVSLQLRAQTARSRPSKPPAYACAFQDPIHFGASISAGYGDLLDGGAAFFHDLAYHENYYGSNYSPAEHMQRSLFSVDKTLNKSELYTSASRFHGDGPAQIRDFLSTSTGRARFSRTTMMAGIDAFYWPSALQKCSKVLAGVDEMIDLAQKENKPLILGNLPNERKELVSQVLIWHGWVPPAKKCVEQVNARLAARCLPEKQCYVIDLHGLVDKLNHGRAFLRGTRLRPEDVRSDGIHLTELGRSLIEGQIKLAMTKNPPACANDEVAQHKTRLRYQAALAAAEDSQWGISRGARTLR